MSVFAKLHNWFSIWNYQFQIRKIPNNRCDKNDKVLIIKLDAIGDFVIWLDSAKMYRAIYPDKEIVLLCNKPCLEIAKDTGYFDQIKAIDIRKFENDKKNRENSIQSLSKDEYGILIQTEYSRTLHMDIIASLIKANKKIGFESDESKLNLSRRLLFVKNKRRLDSIYDELIPSTKGVLMELKRNEEFIHGLGYKDYVSNITELKQNKSEIQCSEKYVVLFPGASSKVKRWSIVCFVEIANYILKNTENDIYVCGTNQEKENFVEIANRVIDKSRVFDLTGKTTLPELIEVIRNAELLVTNDTSSVHFAASVKTKTVCISGENHFGRFLPYPNADYIRVCYANMKCRNCAFKRRTISCYINLLKTGQYSCISRVSVENVIKEIRSLLGE